MEGRWKKIFNSKKICRQKLIAMSTYFGIFVISMGDFKKKVIFFPTQMNYWILDILLQNNGSPASKNDFLL